jgi:CNT family concentrative nucleoside transporter
VFNFLGSLAKTLLGYAGDGTSFLTSSSALNAGWFLVTVLPPMIFFVALVQLLYYWGWLQWLVGKASVPLSAVMGISGAEAVVAAASPFLGQGESAALVRPLLPHMTDAELHQIMASGFATIAGSVLAAYTAMGVSPLALVSSCAMSIPAAVALSKLRWPETGAPLSRWGRRVDVASTASHVGTADTGHTTNRNTNTNGAGDNGIDTADRPRNSLHALALGAWLGIKIAGMVAASVLCVLALLGLVNGLLGWWGSYLDVGNLSVQLVAEYLFYPVAFLLGVRWEGEDLLLVARLIGIKIVANEFVAVRPFARRSQAKQAAPLKTPPKTPPKTP